MTTVPLQICAQRYYQNTTPHKFVPLNNRVVSPHKFARFLVLGKGKTFCFQSHAHNLKSEKQPLPPETDTVIARGSIGDAPLPAERAQGARAAKITRSIQKGCDQAASLIARSGFASSHVKGLLPCFVVLSLLMWAHLDHLRSISLLSLVSLMSRYLNARP